jgi:hypothetical protein
MNGSCHSSCSCEARRELQAAWKFDSSLGELQAARSMIHSQHLPQSRKDGGQRGRTLGVEGSEEHA